MPASDARRCAETTMPLAASTAGSVAAWTVVRQQQ